MVSGVVSPDPVIFESSLRTGILESGEAQTQVDQFATKFIDPVSNHAERNRLGG
jgi:hypothetical protein